MYVAIQVRKSFVRHNTTNFSNFFLTKPLFPIKPFLPAQPALVKFYNVAFGGEMPEKKCCGILCQPKRKMYNKAGGAKLTMEKAGMCGNCAQCGPTNCWVCTSKCQSEAWMHSGNVPSTYSPQGCACCKGKDLHLFCFCFCFVFDNNYVQHALLIITPFYLFPFFGHL